ncbi:VOC family protein [Halalkalicoccus salilacus]|uniref:VOC family protein n=1 Tax=Halalkalicoccus sp. GCM10025704 TaxID=3252662 RepID=UPI00362133F6
MEPRITVITLGVSDLEHSLEFYRDGLGWSTDGIVGTEFEGGAVAFFPLQNGLQLALYPKQQIAADANVEETPPSSAEFTLGHNVASKEEVEDVIRTAEQAGGKSLTHHVTVIGVDTQGTSRTWTTISGK